MSRPAGHVSALQLRFLVLDDRPDWPVVQILADGREAFADQLPGWQGFDPEDMLGDQSPLLPEDQGRRVAVYRCSCGIEGCGVIAPVIMPSPDGRRVSWVDFRDYTGVFAGPTASGTDRCRSGRRWRTGFAPAALITSTPRPAPPVLPCRYLPQRRSSSDGLAWPSRTCYA